MSDCSRRDFLKGSGALLGGAMLATGLEGVGFMLRRTFVIPGVGLLDGVLGAALGAALALGIVWIIAAVAAQTPGQGQLRADIQRSAILSKLNELLPPSGPKCRPRMFHATVQRRCCPGEGSA